MNNDILDSKPGPNDEPWCVYTLKRSYTHRDQSFTKYAQWEDGRSHKINNIRYLVVNLPDDMWWIVPNHSSSDDFMEDIGPYESPEVALMAAKMMES